jgi:hypothetical protein
MPMNPPPKLQAAATLGLSFHFKRFIAKFVPVYARFTNLGVGRESHLPLRFSSDNRQLPFIDLSLEQISRPADKVCAIELLPQAQFCFLSL